MRLDGKGQIPKDTVLTPCLKQYPLKLSSIRTNKPLPPFSQGGGGVKVHLNCVAVTCNSQS